MCRLWLLAAALCGEAVRVAKADYTSLGQRALCSGVGSHSKSDKDRCTLQTGNQAWPMLLQGRARFQPAAVALEPDALPEWAAQHLQAEGSLLPNGSTPPNGSPLPTTLQPPGGGIHNGSPLPSGSTLASGSTTPQQGGSVLHDGSPVPSGSPPPRGSTTPQPGGSVLHDGSPLPSGSTTPQQEGSVLHDGSPSPSGSTPPSGSTTPQLGGILRDGVDLPHDDSPGDVVTVVPTATAAPGSEANVVAEIRGLDVRETREALAHALVVNTMLVLMYTAFFFFLSGSFPLIYKNNVLEGKVPASTDRSCFSSAATAWCSSAEEVEELVGLDGAMFLEFSQLAVRMLASIGAPLLFLLWPLNCAAAQGSNGGLCPEEFRKLTVDVGEHLYWCQAGAVVLVVCIAEMRILGAQRSFIKRRQAWLFKMPMPWCTSVLVENIPPEGRSDANLRRCFEETFGQGAVADAYVVKRTGALPALQAAARAARQRLGEAEELWERSGRAHDRRPTHTGASGQQVDSIFCYGEELKRAQQAVEQTVETVRRATGITGSDLMASTGFVTFRRRLDAAMVVSMRVRLGGMLLRVSAPPEPNDVVYADLMQDPAERCATQCVGHVLVAAVFLLFVPITVAIVSITRLETLQRVVPVFHRITTDHPKVHALWNGMMGSFVLNLAMGFVPSCFAVIFGQCYCLKSELARQKRVQRWYFYFLTLFVLLITTISTAAAQTYLQILKDPSSVFRLLATSLPGTADFYLKFVMFQWSVEALQLTRYSVLLKFVALRMVHRQEARARELAEPEDQDYDGIGARSSRMTLLLVICLVFCTISPLICVLGLICFVLCRASYGYLLLFAESRKCDLGGVFWCTQLKHVQQGLFLYVTLMVGVLFERAKENGPALLAACAFIILVPCYAYFWNLHWERLPLEEATAWDRQRGLEEEQHICGVYQQPELAGL